MKNSERFVIKAVAEKNKIQEGEETESQLEKWSGKVVHSQLAVFICKNT